MLLDHKDDLEVGDKKFDSGLCGSFDVKMQDRPWS